MLFLSWSSPRSLRQSKILKQSAERAGAELSIIPCTSLLDKIGSLARALAGTNPDDLVVCTDAYDCLYLRSAEEIEVKISQFSERIVFSAQATDEHHFVDSSLRFREKYPESRYFALNSGIIAGRAGHMSAMLREISGWDFRKLAWEFDGRGFFNDQTVFGKYFSLHPDTVAIDIDTSLSWTSAYENETLWGYLEEGGSALPPPPCSSVVPCIIHLPFAERNSYILYLCLAIAAGVELTPSAINVVRYRKELATCGSLHPAVSALRKAIEIMPHFAFQQAIQECHYAYIRSRIAADKLCRRVGMRRSIQRDTGQETAKNP